VYFVFILPMEARVPIPAVPALKPGPKHQEVYAYAS
jgi:hypothetical protein